MLAGNSTSLQALCHVTPKEDNLMVRLLGSGCNQPPSATWYLTSSSLADGGDNDPALTTPIAVFTQIDALPGSQVQSA